MTKPEILEIVKQMHKDWCFAKKFSFFSTLNKRVISKTVFSGFCFYLKHELNFTISKRSILINELLKDKNTDGLVFWYETFCNSYSDTKNKLILKLRIDHLQRTIKRLQKEIKNEN